MLRLASKNKGTFKCSNCESKKTSLRRQHAHWPTEPFQALGKEAAQKFMRDIEGKQLSEMERLYEDMVLQGYKKKEDSYEEGGAYYPIIVWAAKGFDIVAIESKSLAENKDLHDVLGEVFRVQLVGGICLMCDFGWSQYVFVHL